MAQLHLIKFFLSLSRQRNPAHLLHFWEELFFWNAFNIVIVVEDASKAE
jgi:hypothetical protein